MHQNYELFTYKDEGNSKIGLDHHQIGSPLLDIVF